ncbi:MAG TPA: hypothetical protein VFR09_00400 [Alphaproteobacteria bacterium]|nr:hypothetical protein [Alphaproteobacteria bacterium]
MTRKKIIDWIFAPPYSGVPWIVWLYAALSCALYTSNGVFAGHLSGFDDHTRMTQILEWINGHGWYDRTIMRANPPEGFTTIWSRLVDMPIAAVILIAQNFTDQRSAVLVSTIVIPFIELALLFPVARYFARPLVGKKESWLVILFLMFTTVLNFKQFSIGGFQTGEASHHPYYTILDLAIFGAAGRIALGSRGQSAMWIMAASTAIVLAVGIEPFPMVATAVALLAFVAWLDSRAMVAQRGAKAMYFAALINFIMLPIHQPPSHLLTASYVEPSILGPILLVLAGLFLSATKFGISFAGKRRGQSFSIMVISGVTLLIAMVACFPEILKGPLAGLSEAEREMAKAIHYEANSVWHVSANFLEFIGLVMPSLIAIIAGIAAVRTATNRRQRAMRFAYLGFAAFPALMEESYSRYIHHALTTACAWLLWCWQYFTDRLKKNKTYALASLAIFVALGPFWMLLLPAMQADDPIISRVLFFPAKVQQVPDACDMLYTAWYINNSYSKDTLLIVPSWDSSRFLYHTEVRLNFVAQYPSQNKFIDNDTFFETRDADQAKDIAIRHNLDLVALCRIPSAYDQGYAPANQLMEARMQTGRGLPKWLKYVDMKLPGNYVLYQVDKKALTEE